MEFSQANVTAISAMVVQCIVLKTKLKEVKVEWRKACEGSANCTTDILIKTPLYHNLYNEIYLYVNFSSLHQQKQSNWHTQIH